MPAPGPTSPPTPPRPAPRTRHPPRRRAGLPERRHRQRRADEPRRGLALQRQPHRHPGQPRCRLRDPPRHPPPPAPLPVPDTHPDAAPPYQSGDTGSDGLMSPGEVWLFSASHTVTQANLDAGSGTHLATHPPPPRSPYPTPTPTPRRPTRAATPAATG